eukprot:Hpha_TRINITY_DN734_c0_g1::TRINITY_DN734_c0_g1_i1::g.28894::m.28894
MSGAAAVKKKVEDKKKKKKKDAIESVIGVADLPGDFAVMRAQLEESRVKAKSAERRHVRENIRDTLQAVHAQLRKIAVSNGPQHDIKRLAFLPEKLQLLDEKHVNAVSDCLLSLLQTLVHSGTWFVFRCKRYHKLVRICQRAVRRWVVFMREKLEWIMYIWTCSEAADQQKHRGPRKKTARGLRITSPQEMHVDYFNCWVPKELKEEVARDCYRERKDKWLKEFRVWRKRAEALREEQTQRKGLLRKMQRSENRARFLAGLSSQMGTTQRKSLSEDSISHSLGIPPTLHWFED